MIPLVALFAVIASVWTWNEWRLAARIEAFDRACQQACDVTADDVDAEYEHLCENGE